MSKVYISLELDVESKDKRAWVAAMSANQQYKNLSEWCAGVLRDSHQDDMIAALNDAANRCGAPVPEWMSGFSMRTADALLKERIAKPDELLARLEGDDKLWWKVVPNLGSAGYIEVLEWRINHGKK